jgi:hypothetical protein
VIKFHGALHVRRPDDVFCTLDFHEKRQYVTNLSS